MLEVTSMTTVYLVRHGESTANVAHICAGSIDVALTKRGRLQAEKLADYLSDKNIDAIYSSDSKRAHNTVQPTADRKGLTITATPLLREAFTGVWEGMFTSDIIETYSEEWTYWKEMHGDSRAPGGESRDEVRDRMYEAISKIAEKNDGKTILIASHAIAIRSFMGPVFNKTQEEGYRDLPVIKNAALSIFTYENGIFTPVEWAISHYLDDLETEVVNVNQT